MVILNIEKTIQTRFNILENYCLEKFYDTRCAYCGTWFNKKYRTEKYCSDDCRHKAVQDQKARYQVKRRKSMKYGFLISNENKRLGTGYVSEHMREDTDLEAKMIRDELKRLHLR